MSLDTFIGENLNCSYKLMSLSGDASARRYYRVSFSEKSCLACIDNNRDNFKHFVEAQKFLYLHGHCVPEIIAQDENEGFLLLEDLGDKSLAMSNFINSKSIESNYKKSIDIIGAILEIKKDREHFFFQWSFDKRKYTEELVLADRFFRNRYLDNNESENGVFFDELIKQLLEMPQRLVHRDFHSRNLHLVNQKIYMIDFQDARVGTYLYDLVSLLEDPYYVLDESLVDVLKDYFLSKYSVVKDKQCFEQDYAVVAVQRLYKILGSFTYLYYEKDKDRYLPYIGTTVSRLNKYLKLLELELAESFRIKLLRKFYES